MTEMLHPYSERWVPYKVGTRVVTIPRSSWYGPFTPEQVRAVLHAVYIVNEVRATQARVHVSGGKASDPVHNPPLHEDYPEKSRALGRLLIEGKPLFEDMPPYELGAAAYWVWDAENDQHKAALDEEFFAGGGGDDVPAERGE